MEDDEIERYYKKAFTEEIIQGYENKLLEIMKFKFEKEDTVANDQEWKEYTLFFLDQRRKRQGKLG